MTMTIISKNISRSFEVSAKYIAVVPYFALALEYFGLGVLTSLHSGSHAPSLFGVIMRQLRALK